MVIRLFQKQKIFLNWEKSYFKTRFQNPEKQIVNQNHQERHEFRNEAIKIVDAHQNILALSDAALNIAT